MLASVRNVETMSFADMYTMLRNPEISEEDLGFLATSQNPRIQIALARECILPESIVRLLFNQCETEAIEEVWVGLLERQIVPTDVLYDMTRNSNWGLRTLIAGKGNLSDEIIDLLFTSHFSDTPVLEVLAANETISVTAIRRIMNENSLYLWVKLIDNPAVPVELVEEIVSLTTQKQKTAEPFRRHVMNRMRFSKKYAGMPDEWIEAMVLGTDK